MRRSLHVARIAFACLVPLGVAKAYEANAGDESQRLNAFFESAFQRDLARSPLRQARMGLKIRQDQWDDISEARQIEDASLVRGDLAALHRFHLDALDAEAKLSYRMFEYQARRALREFDWRRNTYLVTQMGGMHRRIATTLISHHPIATRADAEAYIARLRGVQPLLQTLIDELEKQERAGVIPPRFVYALVIGEAENLQRGRPLDEGPDDNPIHTDIQSKLARTNLREADKVDLLARADAALRESFAPAYRALIAHLRVAESRATDTAGAWKLPRGEAYYRFLLDDYTTEPVTADQLHELGLAEVARIRQDMRVVIKQTGHAGSLPQFFEDLRNNARFHYADSDEGRARYLADANALLRGAVAHEDALFRRKPNIDVVVRSVEAWREKSAAKAFYQGPPDDGSRPGVFYINLHDMSAAPNYQLAAVVYHEAVPGHHIETVVAHQLQNLPTFRRHAGVDAYSEGWGLYAEQLAKETGLYADAYQDFGRLSLALMRAARLVVDTGIHAQHWTREQALAYLDQNLPASHYDNQREIDRYIALPGQATAYYVGLRKILQLRGRAQRALGARFDLRAFHDAILGEGPLPLPLLEEQIDTWINRQHTVQ